MLSNPLSLLWNNHGGLFQRKIDRGVEDPMKRIMSVVFIILLLSTGCTRGILKISEETTNPPNVEWDQFSTSEDSLVGSATHIFVGEYLGNQPVDGITKFTQDLFRVHTWLKSIDDTWDTEVPVNRYAGMSINWTPTVGGEYLVLTCKGEAPVWPVPINNTTLVVQLDKENRAIPSSITQYLGAMPFLSTSAFLDNPIEYIKSVPSISKKAAYIKPSIINAFDSVEKMTEAADLIIASKLTVFDSVDNHVYGCRMDASAKIWKNISEILPPDTVALPFSPVPGVEYLLFFRLFQYSDGSGGSYWEIIARQGAAIPSSEQASWDAVRKMVE